MNIEIQEQLEQLAHKRSLPFCYGCYREAPTGHCASCGSDDLMRLLPRVGCEYGTDWIIRSILEGELTPVDLDEAFEQSIRECYPETVQVGWMTLDTVSIMKKMDSVSCDCARSEWESQEAGEGSIISFDNGFTYYWRNDIDSLLETTQQ